MDAQKGFITRFGEWWDGQRVYRNQVRTTRVSSCYASWLPSRGNVIFTLLMIALLVAAQTAGALPLARSQTAPAAASTGTIAYQGRLADAAGAPLTGTYNMIFRLYDTATGGTPLWSESWTGSNGVRVSDGLFNVMLGSLSALPISQFTNSQSLFLGITVGTDDEMAPRVQLGSVPFAVQALTVPDGSVTTGKIADGAVNRSKVSPGVFVSAYRMVRDTTTRIPPNQLVYIGDTQITTTIPTRLFVACNMTIQPSDAPVTWVGLSIRAVKGDKIVSLGDWMYIGPNRVSYMSWSSTGILNLPEAGNWILQCMLGRDNIIGDPVIHTYSVTAVQID